MTMSVSMGTDCVAMVTHQVIGLLADVREMKEKIKETKNDQDHVDIE